MSKKRGLSLDDKRRVILSIYHDQKVPFNLKEIEATASRMGVVQQTIKDVNQSLVDDNFVLSDKIGSSNFFWSFPSKSFEDMKHQREKYRNVVDGMESGVKDIQHAIEVAQVQRSGPDRASKLRKLEVLQEREKQADSLAEMNKSNDPEEVKRIQKQTSINKTAANRWTDNIWVIKQFLTKKKGMAGKEADKFLKIDAAFDYI